jgi:hypothetical protein
VATLELMSRHKISYRGAGDYGNISAIQSDGGDATSMGRSMKTERAIIQLARRKFGVKLIATKLNIHPKSVINTGRALGIYFTPLERKWAARQRTKEA